MPSVYKQTKALKAYVLGIQRIEARPPNSNSIFGVNGHTLGITPYNCFLQDDSHNPALYHDLCIHYFSVIMKGVRGIVRQINQLAVCIQQFQTAD
jgi:hypothetical protein